MARQNKDFIRYFLKLGSDEKQEFGRYLKFVSGQVDSEENKKVGRVARWYESILIHFKLEAKELGGEQPELNRQLNERMQQHEWLEKVWNSAFGNDSKPLIYDEAKGRKYLSDLRAHILEYFKWRFLLKNPQDTSSRCVLYEALSERRLDEDLVRIYKKRENSPLESTRDFLVQADLTIQLYKDQLRTGKRDNPRADSYLMESFEHMDTFFITEKLKKYCEAHCNLGMGGETPSTRTFRMRESILGMAKLPPFEQVPLLQLYYHLCMLFEGANEPEHLVNYTKRFQEQSGVLAKSELKNLENLFQNYLIRQLNTVSGERKRYYQENLFQVYQTRLSSSRIFVNGFLSRNDFKNIVALALKLDRLAEAENIVLGFGKYLEPELRADAVGFCDAHIAFYSGEHKRARNLLARIPDVDLFYGIDIRSIRLKSLLETCFVEKDDMKTLLSLLASFRKFIDRKKQKGELPKDRWKRQLNRLKIVNEFLRITSSNNSGEPMQRRVEGLIEDLNAESHCTDKEYLRNFLTNWLQDRY